VAGPDGDRRAGPATGLTSVYEHYAFPIEAVANGLGGAVAPYHLILDRLRDGRVVAPFGFVESGRTYVVRAPRALNPRSKAFCAWLQAEIKADPPSVAFRL
jgi:LysR family transcriptional regulator, glycine cleavage system transcriptional activator